MRPLIRHQRSRVEFTKSELLFFAGLFVVLLALFFCVLYPVALLIRSTA